MVYRVFVVFFIFVKLPPLSLSVLRGSVFIGKIIARLLKLVPQLFFFVNFDFFYIFFFVFLKTSTSTSTQ